MSHRVIYIEKCENLKLYLDNLKVIINDKDILIPLSDIMILVIDNYKAVLSVHLINKLVDNNVCTILCGVDHLPNTMIIPTNGNFAQSGNMSKQILWNEERKQLLHQLIVKAKINNQIEILKKHNKEESVIQRLKEFSEEVTLGDLGNREGLAAKMYFRELYGEYFIRMDETVINAGLNYGYAIFRSLITSIIVAKGYIPNFGLFHKGKQNMYNLSDDIIEVFRPIIDNYVYMNLMDEILFKQKHREELIQLTTKKLIIDEQKQSVANAIYIYFESILKVIDSGNIEDFVYPLPFLL